MGWFDFAYMSYSICHARHFIFVAEAAHIDVQGSTSFVGLRVMAEKGHEPVSKTNYAIVTIVKGGLLERVRQNNHGSMAASGQTRGLCRRH